MFFSFTLCIVTSVILYITPYGRVAYWSDWHLWGLNKTQWGELHLNLGLLMLIAGLLHLYYNWRPLLAYIKNRARKINIFSPNSLIALFLTLVVGVGTYFQLPPLATIINFGTQIKDAASITYGEPPYGHAELSSLAMFANKMDLDLAKALELLRQEGIVVENEKQLLVDIAKTNKLVPKQVYDIIKSASENNTMTGHPVFPASPPPGFGNKVLIDICTEYGLDVKQTTSLLLGQGLLVDPSANIRSIAADNKMEPMALFEVVRDAALRQVPK
jgi:hypothetical protein